MPERSVGGKGRPTQHHRIDRGRLRQIIKGLYS